MFEQQEEQVPQSRWRRFFKETIRVLRILKKPDKAEYLTTVKVTGIGIAIIGVLGFLIFLLRQMLI
ncbi:TPA: protein translocase SEC61 complex subunit gamma [Candidatus Woesearchaeota archaeon]|nr:protein translocase SEC61 complex subunit gamma [Candidatus Woesearchaeota archaeon]